MTDRPDSQPELTRIDTVIATLDQVQAELDKVQMIQAMLIGAMLALALEVGWLMWRTHAGAP